MSVSQKKKKPSLAVERRCACVFQWQRHIHQRDYVLEVSLVRASRVGWGRGWGVIKGRLIALWETKGSTIMCS